MKYQVTQEFINSKIPYTYSDECAFQRKFIIHEHRSNRVADLLLKVWEIVKENKGEISIVDLSDKRIKVSIFKDEFNDIEE